MTHCRISSEVDKGIWNLQFKIWANFEWLGGTTCKTENANIENLERNRSLWGFRKKWRPKLRWPYCTGQNRYAYIYANGMFARTIKFYPPTQHDFWLGVGGWLFCTYQHLSWFESFRCMFGGNLVMRRIERTTYYISSLRIELIFTCHQEVLKWVWPLYELK